MFKALITTSILLFSSVALSKATPVYGPTNLSPEVKADAQIKYFGSVIELKPEHAQKYRELHADVWPEVVAAIKKSNIHNYHIFVAPLQGKQYLFSYFEYHGNDMEKDFAFMTNDPTTRDKWWPLTDSYQQIIPGTPAGAQWMNIEPLMHIK